MPSLSALALQSSSPGLKAREEQICIISRTWDGVQSRKSESFWKVASIESIKWHFQ